MILNNGKIYLFFIMSTISTLHCMECVNYLNNEVHDFTNKIVLDYYGHVKNACHIAQTASIVHSDICYKKLDDISLMREKYAHVKNLIFTEPQSKFYDVVTIYNYNVLCKEDMLGQLARTVRDYLKKDGEIHAFIRTQNNYLSIENVAMMKLYPRVYALLSEKIKEQLGTEAQPSLFAETFKLEFSTDDEVKEEIWKAGYNIISYKEIYYEDVVKVIEIKKILKADFFKLIQWLELLKKTKKILWKEYIELVLNQYKKNDNGDVIVPVRVTKIHLKNTDSMRLCLNMNIFAGR